MYEVELKFAVAEPMDEKLQALGAFKASDVKRIVDTYYTVPGVGDTGKVFRIRAITETMFDGTSTTHHLTCKGKALETASKTRREIEIEVKCDFDLITQFVELLGCTKAGTVEKSRQEWLCTHDEWGYVICVDTLTIGQYLEIELIAETEEACAAASDAILELASRLNLGEPERRSYFELLNGKRNQITGDSRA